MLTKLLVLLQMMSERIKGDSKKNLNLAYWSPLELRGRGRPKSLVAVPNLGQKI